MGGEPPVSEWFGVEFDQEVVRLSAEPLGEEPWSQQFRWADIERICFRVEDITVSDGIYVFTRTRPESFAVPIEARGGKELWEEILSRGLFDAELAIEAAASTEGVFCWPPMPTESFE